ncbi:MAG: dihydrofolate reductase [Chthoniobacterales bacterium]
MIAIAAMGINRAIGIEGRIPWHLSKDMKFFRHMTLGNIVVMGRKTFESLGKPLAGRENIVLSRQPLEVPDIRVVASPEEITEPDDGRGVFVIGGAEIYRALLPRCSELLLTVVKQSPEADTFFPEFETKFALAEILDEDADLEIRRYVKRQ